jgi:hypothetical protein
MMDKIIGLLKTPEDCMEAADTFTDLANQAKRRAVELRANSQSILTDVESELWRVIYAYEAVLSKKNKRRTLASRTRQMIKRYGIIEAAERAIKRGVDAMGYRTLIEMGYQDLTFETVITRFPKYFKSEIVKQCIKRLDELNNLPSSH